MRYSGDRATATARERLGEFDAFQLVFLGLTLLLSGIHLALAVLDPAPLGSRAGQFLIIGMAFFAGFVVQLTPYWRPVLYLLGAAFALFLGAVWLLGSTDWLAVGVGTTIVAVAFTILALYLFFREESLAVSS